MPIRRIVEKTGGRTPKTNPVSKPDRVSRSYTDSIDLSIPTDMQEPTGSISDAAIFIHGEPGIGKTRLAAEFPDALDLMFEPGGKFFKMRRLPRDGQFTKWSQFVKVVDNLLETDIARTIIFDTVDLAWMLASKQVTSDANEESINEGSLGYGKGVDRLDTEFKSQILRITGSGRGVIFISHTQSKDFQKSTGVVTPKLISTVAERGRRFLNGFCDLTGCYAYNGDDRYLIIRGSDGVDAKCRLENNFLTPDGEPVYAIPMGTSPKEAFDNFMIAYNNEQEDPHVMRRKLTLSEVRVPFKKK